MPVFKFQTKIKNYEVQLDWQGLSYEKNPITVRVVDNEKILRILGTINYEKQQAKEGYKFKDKDLGEIIIKFVRKFLIINEIQVWLNGERLKGNEIIDYSSI